MVKEVRQPCLDIDSGKFAATAHNRVHHGGILCRIVILARLCLQHHYVGIERYVIVSQRVDLLVHNIMFGILRQVLKWAGVIYNDRGCREMPNNYTTS